MLYHLLPLISWQFVAWVVRIDQTVEMVVIVLDEASMIDTRDFATVMALMNTHPHVRVVAGDTDQFPSIKPGGRV